MAGIPSTFNSRDVGAGGANTYAGAVSTLENGPVLDPVEAYPDDIISGHTNLGSAAIGTSAVNTVLHQSVKEWTLDHVDLSLDVLAAVTSNITITFYKIPVGTAIAGLGAGHVIGIASVIAANDYDGNDIKFAFEFQNTPESERRFARGERLMVAIIASTSVDGGQKDISFLGRTRLI